MSVYLFVLSLPYSGSTVLWRLLATSPNVSSFPIEGQNLDSVRSIMRAKPWDADYEIPWDVVKSKWEAEWDLSKPILLEKSPPNLIRAFEIEKVFSPSYFIIVVRDPYAFCQGYMQRQKTTPEDAARFWVRCAEQQKRNMEGLCNSLFLSYESFTENPLGASDQILQFMPQLQSLQPESAFLAQSIISYEARKITNFNQLKINQLSSKDISGINRILELHSEYMKFFSYDFIQPTRFHDLKRYKSLMELKLIQFFARVKRVSKSVVPTK